MSEQLPDDRIQPQQPPESQQPADDELAFPNLKSGVAWGESITKQRADELEAILQEWKAAEDHGVRKSPFDLRGFDRDSWRGFDLLLTGGDVFWLAARTLAGTNDMQAIADAAERIRADTHVPVNPDASANMETSWVPPILKAPPQKLLRLEGAILDRVQLQNANLDWAHLEGASFIDAHLQGAYLRWAHLEGASFIDAHLQGAILHNSHLQGASFISTHLESAVMERTHLENASFWLAHLEGVHLDWAHLEGASFLEAHLEGASLYAAHLEDVQILSNTHLQGAGLNSAHLEGARLANAHLEGKRMPSEDLARIRQWNPHFRDVLQPADIRFANFDGNTDLRGLILGDDVLGYISISDVRWRDANLAVVGWTRLRPRPWSIGKRIEAIELGDVRMARKPTNWEGKPKNLDEWIEGYKNAVRANRQLATVLRQQGLNEDANRFAYIAQTLQREVLKRQGNFGGYIFSLLLWALSGYGYRLWRIAAAYGLVLLAFAVIFLALGVHSYPGEPGVQALWDSFLVSLSAIHGRTMFEQLGAWTPAAWLAAVESVVGIVIEGVFVAMLIQRFFAR